MPIGNRSFRTNPGAVTSLVQNILNVQRKLHSRKLEGTGVEMQGGTIALADMKRNILGIETLDH